VGSTTLYISVALAALLSLAVFALLVVMIVSGLRLSRNIRRSDREIWKSITKGFPFVLCPMPGLLKRLKKSIPSLGEELRGEAKSYIKIVRIYFYIFFFAFVFLVLLTAY